MKTNQSFSPGRLKPFLLAFLIAFSLYSCKKEDPISMAAAEIEADKSDPWAGFDQKGAGLEVAFSMAISDEALSKLIVLMAYQRDNGDTEVLLSDLLAVPLKAGGTVADYVAAKSRGNVTAAELNDFAADFPGTILGVRGNPTSWMQGSHTPPVKFVPRDFVESTKSTTATQAGNPTTLDLSQPFTDAVLVLMEGERFTGRKGSEGGSGGGQPDGNLSGGRLGGPQFGAGDVGGVGLSSVVCDPEPTACPSVEPSLTAFTATPQNGGMLLNYTVSDLPSSFCTWGRIRISRLNPDGSYKTWWRWANQPTSFYDDSGDPEIFYTYSAQAYVAYLSDFTGDWVTCPAAPNTISQSIQYPASGAIVDSYEGSNQSSTSIRYDWALPAGVSADKVRIRRATTTNYVTLDDNIPATQTSYFYNNIPSQYRGTKIETQIQYKASGPWQGTFFDRTYASFREAGEPLYFNGISMDLVAFEYAESPLYGAPEMHLSAVQANANEGTNEIVTKYLPMSGCLDPTPFTIVIPNFNWWPFGIFFITYTTETIMLDVNNGLYYPTSSPNGYPILNNWNPDLFSSAITVTLLESDAGEVNTTGSTTTETTSTSVNAKLGFKKGILDVGSVGVTSDWKNATETTVEYPTDALPFESDRTIFYHEPRTVVKGSALFSTQTFSNNCQVLGANL